MRLGSVGPTTAKWAIAILVVVFLAVAGGIWYMEWDEQQQVDKATALADQSEELQVLKDRTKETRVHLVELVIGPMAAATLRACYGHGYPETHQGMSPKSIQHCDRVTKQLEKAEKNIPDI